MRCPRRHGLVTARHSSPLRTRTWALTDMLSTADSDSDVGHARYPAAAVTRMSPYSLGLSPSRDVCRLHQSIIRMAVEDSDRRRNLNH
jgi:hypothetical protein